jgi:adenylate kinase
MTASLQLLHGKVLIPFIAPPNGGKGTQTALLSEKFNLPRIDMGATLRLMAKADNEVGRRIRAFQDQGQLVDTPTVVDALEQGLATQLAEQPGLVGFILDGFPRNPEQASGLLALCQATGANIAMTVYLDVPDESIIERAANRRICPTCGTIYSLTSHPSPTCDKDGAELEHRVDDQPDRVKARLVSFAQETQPILQVFEDRGVLKRVNGNRTVAEVTTDLVALIQPLVAQKALA